MAIYYIDPHTATNGDGSYASPWSFSSSTRTGLTDGDEIRVLGVALSNLLTATTYTVTYTNNYQLTVTAGGSLGADFSANTIIYFPDDDTFSRVSSVAGNVLSLSSSSSSIMPHKNVLTSQPAFTIRIVDTATYGVSTTSSTGFVGPAVSSMSNITVSDGWIDATTQVTDGSVKTLVTSSSTVANFPFNAFSSTSAISASSNININLGNTHVIGSQSTAAYVSLNVRDSNTTVVINQILNRTSSNGILAFGGSATNTAYNIDLTMKSAGFGAAPFFNGKYFTLTVDNFFGFDLGYFVIGVTAYTSFSSLETSTPSAVININNGYMYANNYACLAQGWVFDGEVSFNGDFRCYSTNGLSSLYRGTSLKKLTLGSGFNYRFGASNALTSSAYGVIPAQTSSKYCAFSNLPEIVNNSSLTLTYYLHGTGVDVIPLGAISSAYKDPGEFVMTAPVNTWNANYSVFPRVTTASPNIVIKHLDGSAPYEILSIQTPYYGTPTTGANNPIITLDSTTYYSSGPSLKSHLETKASVYWADSSSYPSNISGKVFKNIKVPVTSGSSYTVTGYIRNNITSFANGDVRMSINYAQAEIVGQNMTTASNSAWEQFTLTFTATETAEYLLCWEMYYINAGDIWLDDLVITES